MTKYSTGSSDEPEPDDDGASCSLCGATENLTTGEVAGAQVVICRDCSDSDDSQDDERESQDEREDYSTGDNYSSGGSDDSGTGGYTITNPDSSWVEDDRPDYGNTDTPYLVPNYSEVVNSAIQQNDYTVEEVAEATGMHPETVQAVVDGNAISAGVDVEVIDAIENYLEVEIKER